ncbi:MAG: hypothetical protein COB49_01740 [Alphaproteobacteria bacterium]|nr:MAG: hypothetical protein COB49_01740 [Alphaproteobacteria bacterium]
MQTKICPTCGCSLVRLGITDQQSEQLTFQDMQYFFCCQGCKDIFLKDPEPFVKEVADIHVCPVCLAEKPTAYTVSLIHKGQQIHFCRCIFCTEAFKKDPDYYLDRLAGKTDFKGLFDGNDVSCCH